jgi:hypothetical protein
MDLAPDENRASGRPGPDDEGSLSVLGPAVKRWVWILGGVLRGAAVVGERVVGLG